MQEVSQKEQLQEEEDAAGLLSPVEVAPLQSTLRKLLLISAKLSIHYNRYVLIPASTTASIKVIFTVNVQC